MIRIPSLHRDDALLLSRCVYLGLIVLLFPLKSAYSVASLSAEHFHPPLGPDRAKRHPPISAHMRYLGSATGSAYCRLCATCYQSSVPLAQTECRFSDAAE